MKKIDLYNPLKTIYALKSNIKSAKMSVNNYLNTKEEILYKLEIRGKDKRNLSEILGVTNKRVFHFQNLKGYDRIYRDIPLSHVKYLENGWHSINILKLIIGIILILIGVGLLMNIYVMFFSIIPLIPGIILVIKALKQKGYFLINNNDWKFEFTRKENIQYIEEIIQNIYFLQSL